ncbi:pyridoxamine 5'-phosphate oxidase family protein [Blastococcus sp. TF02A-26]|uniref:pyridoxamine 5'-phosphate oxidase family protein n=1 Tax=Blastococcus sp. TF02A-26 TaxID=2250577 RepID=UPI0013143581|nr:pyridoxamine 5'-phosphate oxidase family protein [Blastococcus sp. TF02A-26]
MDSSTGSLDVIPVDECYQLLASHEVGRIGVTLRHRVLIIPVNYGMDGQTLIVRTHPGATLTAAAHANVSFQVDDIDRTTRSGWSVLVHGLAEEVGDRHWEDVVRRTHAVEVRPWAPGEHGRWLRIIPQGVSGRRLVPGDLPWGVDDRAYL